MVDVDLDDFAQVPQDETVIYTAGPIAHAEDGGRGWRERVKEEYPDDFVWLSPHDIFDVGEDNVTFLPADEIRDYEPSEGEEIVSDRILVEMDKRAIDIADAVLIGYRNPVRAWGTPYEQAYTFENEDAFRPIVGWVGDFPLSPWFRVHCDFYSQSLDDCIKFLQSIFNTHPICLSCRKEYDTPVGGRTIMATDEVCEWCHDDVGVEVAHWGSIGDGERYDYLE